MLQRTEAQLVRDTFSSQDICVGSSVEYNLIELHFKYSPTNLKEDWEVLQAELVNLRSSV